jgi:L-alanine-DL-glutamate epimerase-like enolase superfamily enzyme
MVAHLQGADRVRTSAVKIEQVDTFLVDLPTIRPHHLAMTTMCGQTLMLVRIRMSDGIVGWGEGTTIGGLAYGCESPEGMKLAIDTYFLPILLGCDANRVGLTMATIGKAVQGNHFAKSAVETALVDALGKRTGVAASELLGGRQHDRLPVAIDGDKYLHDDFAFGTRDDLIPPVERVTDASEIHKAGLNKPFVRIGFDFRITREVAGAPGTVVHREHAVAA